MEIIEYFFCLNGTSLLILLLNEIEMYNKVIIQLINRKQLLLDDVLSSIHISVPQYIKKRKEFILELMFQ